MPFLIGTITYYLERQSERHDSQHRDEGTIININREGHHPHARG